MSLHMIKYEHLWTNINTYTQISTTINRYQKISPHHWISTYINNVVNISITIHKYQQIEASQYSKPSNWNKKQWNSTNVMAHNCSGIKTFANGCFDICTRGVYFELSSVTFIVKTLSKYTPETCAAQRGLKYTAGFMKRPIYIYTYIYIHISLSPYIHILEI